ncbi:MAG: response regulator [Hyphomicrobiaceae bacterium]|nr:response regulator [Hyphomicrobiaceae bacterium]
MPEQKAKRSVFVVDDDIEFAKSVQFLLSSVNLNVRLFDSAENFLAALKKEDEGCVLIDVRMPGMSGLEAQHLLADTAPTLPIIIMTAHGDIEMAVRAMKDGAMDFIQKPFNDQRLIDLINKAMKLNTALNDKHHHKIKLRERLHELSPREHEVLDLIVEGNTNKEIGYRLGIADKTVEAHRAKIMEKTKARTLQDLMKLIFSIAGDK